MLLLSSLSGLHVFEASALHVGEASADTDTEIVGEDAAQGLAATRTGYCTGLTG